jgi:hypothetical protein
LKETEATTRGQKFETDITEAKKQLGMQEERAARAETELLKLKNPRTLSPESIAILKKAPPGKAVVRYQEGPPEAKIFAGNIYGALLDAGWDMTASPVILPGRFPPGLGISEVVVLGGNINGINDPKTPIGAFEEAVKKSGYHFGATLDPSLPTDSFVILIGQRL